MTPRTSATHPLRVDWLPVDGPGRVGMTIAPGKHSVSKYTTGLWARDLDTDLDHLVQGWHVTDLVCLLETRDLERLQIPQLLEQARSRGLVTHWLPMPDGGVPPNVASVQQLVADLVVRVDGGAVVAIHCEGGLGRTGIVAGCYLVARGYAAEDALLALRKARNSDRCPETEGQRAFIRGFAPWTAGHPDERPRLM